MSFLPLLFGVAQGAFGAIGASGQEKAAKATAASIAEAAGLSQQQVNQRITDQRVQAIFASSQMFRAAMGAVSQANLGLSEGQSAIDFGAQLALLSGQDKAVLDRNLTRSEEQAEVEKQNIVNAAKSGVNQALAQAPNPLLAGLQGALGGVQMGMSLQTSLDQMSFAKKQLAAFGELQPLQDSLFSLAKQSQALNIDLARAGLAAISPIHDQLFGQMNLLEKSIPFIFPVP